MQDRCLNCGAEHNRELWGATCSCGNANVVHQEKCTGCGSVIGQITDDDYHGPEKLYCPACMGSSRKNTSVEKGVTRKEILLAGGHPAAPVGNYPGLSIRQHYALELAKVFLANDSVRGYQLTAEGIAEQSFQLADALLAEDLKG